MWCRTWRPVCPKVVEEEPSKTLYERSSTSLLHHVPQVNVHQSLRVTSSSIVTSPTIPLPLYAPDSYILSLLSLSLTTVSPPTTLRHLTVSPGFPFIADCLSFSSPLPSISIHTLSYPRLEVNGWFQSVRAEWLITVEDRGCCSSYQHHLYSVNSAAYQFASFLSSCLLFLHCGASLWTLWNSTISHPLYPMLYFYFLQHKRELQKIINGHGMWTL